MVDVQPPAIDVSKLESLLTHNFVPIMVRIVQSVCQARGQLLSKADIEDLSQDIYVLLIKDDYRALRTYQHLAAPRTWLYTVVDREILHRLRGRKKEMIELEDLPLNFQSYNPGYQESLLFEQYRAIVLTAVSELKDYWQELYWLLCVEELESSEIAKRLSVTCNKAYRDKDRLPKMIAKHIRQGQPFSNGSPRKNRKDPDQK